MPTRCGFKLAVTVILVLLPMTAVSFAQSAICDLRLKTFLLQKSDYPQNAPIKNARATLVDLDTNATLTSRLVSGVPYFAEIPQGEYNLVVIKDDFRSTVKRIRVKCELTDEKGVFDEIVFLSDDKKIKNYRMTQIDFKIPGEFPAVPPSPLAASEVKSSLYVTANEIAVTERAVYLPFPVFSTELEKIKNKLVSESTSFVISVSVEIDEDGNVKNASVNDRDNRIKELIPSIIESAKRAKFVPVKVRGERAVLLGFVNYVFSK